jgi:hypothetical protein
LNSVLPLGESGQQRRLPGGLAALRCSRLFMFAVPGVCQTPKREW